MKKVVVFYFLFLLFCVNFGFGSDVEQEDVAIMEFIDCKWYNLWCQMKKTIINSAYESQETQYNSLLSVVSGVELIKTSNFDSLIIDLNLFMLNLLALYFQFRAMILLFRMMFSGGDKYQVMRTKEEFANILKSILLIMFLPMLIIIVNDFFVQINKVFIGNNDFASVVLQDYNLEDNFVEFSIVTKFNAILVFLLTGFSLFFKLLIYLGPLIMGFVGAMWYSSQRYNAKLLMKLLFVAYIHIPILIVVFRMINAMYDSDFDVGTTFALFLLLIIYIFLVITIFITNIVNRIANVIQEKTREGFVRSVEELNKHFKNMAYKEAHKNLNDHDILKSVKNDTRVNNEQHVDNKMVKKTKKIKK